MGFLATSIHSVSAAVRFCAGHAPGPAVLKETRAVFKGAKTSLKLVDDALGAFKIARNKLGMIEFNGLSAGKLNRIIRSGNLDALMHASGKKVPVTSAQRAAFRSLLSDAFPDLRLQELGENVSRARKRLPHMDATVENMGKLSTSGRADLKTAESRLKKVFKEGAVVALVVGVAVVGADWLRKATNARRGCFMFSTYNGKTSSCKVAQFSCLSANSGGKMCMSTPRDLYNNTLVLMNLVELPNDDSRKVALARATETPVERLAEDIARLVSDKFDKVAACIAAMRPEERTFGNICSITNARLGGAGADTVSECRMCTPSADPTHTAYIDASLYADNVTFECVENPTMLETLVDAATSTGVDLLSGLGGTVFGGLKRAGLWIGAILVLAIVATLVFRFARPRHRPDADRRPLITRNEEEEETANDW